MPEFDEQIKELFCENLLNSIFALGAYTVIIILICIGVLGYTRLRASIKTQNPLKQITESVSEGFRYLKHTL